MKLTRVDAVSNWEIVKRAALRTMGLTPKTEPTDEWKAQMLLCEHSPIRLLSFYVSIEGIKTWLTGHFCRHWLGFIPFVHSQRDDRRKLDCSRDELPQGSLNDMDFHANAQALINISRKRLCGQAHKETRDAWEKVRHGIADVDPVMASKMVPECVYRGFCPEKKCCGYVRSKNYNAVRAMYVKEAGDGNLPTYELDSHNA